MNHCFLHTKHTNHTYAYIVTTPGNARETSLSRNHPPHSPRHPSPLTVAGGHSEGGERRIKATIRSPAASLLVVPPGSDETFIYGGQSSFREGRGKRGYMREKGLLSMCKSRCGQS